MGIVTVLPLVDYFSVSGGQHSLTQELHTVGSASPYAIDLYEIPKVYDLATNLALNEYTTYSAAQTLMVIQVELTTGNWTTHTLTDDTVLEATECALQMRDQVLYPYSPRLVFHSSCAGKAARVSYIGMGSQPLASYLTTIQTSQMILEASTQPVGLSLASYNDGAYDAQGTDGKGLYLSPAHQAFVGTDGGRAVFPGLEIDCDDSGNGEIAAFTTAYYWKRVFFGLDYVSSAWALVTQESAEAATQSALVTPQCDPRYWWLVSVDVQNTGTTGAAGEITAIAQADIEAMPPVPVTPLESFRIEYDGAILLTSPATDIAIVFPGRAGYVTSMSLMCDTPGSAGTTNLQLYRCNAADTVGTALLSSPIAIASGATPVIVQIDAGDMIADRTFTALQWLRLAPVTQVATGAMNCQGVVRC